MNIQERNQREVEARSLILLHNIAVISAVTHLKSSRQKWAYVKKALKKAEDDLFNALMENKK